jgi:hypothetical protein
MVIDSGIFVLLTDRLAKQYQYLEQGVSSGIPDGSNGNDYDIVTGTDDYDVERVVGTAAETFDVNYTVAKVVASVGSFATLINGIETNLKTFSYATFDTYCSGQGVKVAKLFDDVYYIVKNKHIAALYVEDRVVTL